MLQHNDIIYDGGNRYRVAIEHDEDSGTPWESEDGHGPVTDWTDRPKAPGERVLSVSGRASRFYNVQQAVEIAKRDGWNTPPYEIVGESAAERAVRAVDADFRHLRDWCLDRWEYLVVRVQLVDALGRKMEDHPTIQTFWEESRIESIDPEAVEKEARNLATLLTESLREAGLVYLPARWVPAQ